MGFYETLERAGSLRGGRHCCDGTILSKRMSLEKVVVSDHATSIFFYFENVEDHPIHINFYLPTTPEALRMTVGSKTLSLKDVKYVDHDRVLFFEHHDDDQYWEFSILSKGWIEFVGTFDRFPDGAKSFALTEGDVEQNRAAWVFPQIVIPQQ